MTRYRPIAALLMAAAVAACGDYEKKGFQDITGPVTGARVKFFNFGVNAPTVNFYANDTKITAIASGSCFGVTDTAAVRICNSTGLESTNGVAYGSAGLGGLYSLVQPGQYTLNGRISAVVDKDLQVAKVPATVEAGKAYSAYVSGFYNTATKSVEGFVVEDPVPETIDFSSTYIRFVNAMSNSQPMTLYAASTTAGGVETAVGTAVAYKAAGAFTKLTPGVYDVNTRVAGSSTNVISRTAVSFSAGRVYTISARGDITVVSTTATNRPFLDNTANK